MFCQTCTCNFKKNNHCIVPVRIKRPPSDNKNMYVFGSQTDLNVSSLSFKIGLMP